MEPSKKSPEMTKVLDSLTKEVFGNSRTESIKGNTCVTCGGPADNFRDPLSVKEYSISGMCQKCQDSVFGASEEDEKDESYGEYYSSLEDPDYK